MWTKKKLLVIAKTYPEFSKSHRETVCTAAIDADTGGLVRIYPLSLRFMDEPPKSFDWIEAEVQKNPKDPRPESFKIRHDKVRIIDSASTQNGWRERNTWVLKPTNEYKSVEELWAANEANGTSLGLLRPLVIEKVYAVTKTQEDHTKWEEKRRTAMAQDQLFGDDKDELRELKFQWVEYRIAFHCDDPRCKGHDMGVHDWGMYVLDMKLNEQEGDYKAAEEKVLAKIKDILDPAKNETRLLLGNTLAYPRTFFIGGIYYPPRQAQAGFGFLQVADPAAIGRPQQQVRKHRAVAARRVDFEAE